MLILALEASAKAASAALCRDGLCIGQYFQNCGQTHSKTLLPMIQDLLRNTGQTIEDVDLLAVSQGPGSFTGVRIGVSTAKGLAWAAEKPVVGVSTLEAMAWNGLAAPEGAVICCAMDARRNQVYNALFVMEKEEPVRLCPDRPIGLEELTQELAQMGKTVFLLGDGAQLCRAKLEQAGIPSVMAPEPMALQSAWGVARAAQGKMPGTADDLLPVYLRLSQAERERQALLSLKRK